MDGIGQSNPMIAMLEGLMKMGDGEEEGVNTIAIDSHTLPNPTPNNEILSELLSKLTIESTDTENQRDLVQQFVTLLDTAPILNWKPEERDDGFEETKSMSLKPSDTTDIIHQFKILSNVLNKLETLNEAEILSILFVIAKYAGCSHLDAEFKLELTPIVQTIINYRIISKSMKKDPSQSVWSHYFEAFLTKTIRKLFESSNKLKPKRLSPSPNNTNAAYKLEYKKEEEEEYINGKWNTEFVDELGSEWRRNGVVNGLVYWCCQVRYPEFDSLLHFMLPPLLTLLEDHELIHKQSGLTLLNHIFIARNVLPTTLRKYGLSELLINTLFNLLYITESDAASITFLKTSYKTLINLIPILYNKHDQDYFTVCERFILDGYLRNLAFAIGGKFEVLTMYMDILPDVITLLDGAIVMYTQALLEPICEMLVLYTAHPPTFLSLCNGVISLMKACWPRIPSHRGLIMKSVAKAWAKLAKEVKEESISPKWSSDVQKCRQSLIDILQLLKKVCDGTEFDIDEHLQSVKEMSPETFSSLIDAVLVKS